MTLLEKEREALAAPPTHTELVLRLHALVKAALSAGATRDQVLADLAQLRDEVRDSDAEDVVLDVMDAVTGWVSPHLDVRHP